ncbi:MAG: Gfo/Idh/MocA family oxidoreductase [Caulobacterales bacterium]
MSELKAGVIGAGVFGGHHARKYQSDARVKLIGVFDVDATRAETLAADLGVKAFASMDDLLSQVELVTVASPPFTHAGAARAALEAGAHVLVEKPLAVDVADGETLVKLAAQNNRVLACGHQERLVFEAMGLFETPEQPTKIECVRAGPWTGRSADVSVTLDLMVHDLDLAIRLMGGKPKRVSARGRAVETNCADDIKALLTFPEGARAELVATRVAPERKRTMRLVYPSGEVKIDFIARTFENSTSFALNEAFAETPGGKDPLGANVIRFIDAITGAAKRPFVNGEEALAVLELARAVDRAADFPSLATAESDNASVH